MTSGTPAAQSALGFLTVLAHDQLGLVGGYLVLNAMGRPLEFHCTAPVKPNRAQQILFGPTLDSYLYGEQIGQTLLAKATIEPLAVCTDCPPALAVRDFIALPVALVLDAPPTADAPAAGVERPASAPLWRVDPPHQFAASLCRFDVGGNQLAVPAGRDAERELIASRLHELGDFDLREPFGRIREAVEEAHKGARG